MTTKSASPSIAIGIDLGGTAIKGGLVDAEGRILHRATTATEASGGVDHVIGRIATLIAELAATARAEHDADPAGVGVGAPGTLSHRRGVVIAPPNLEGWRDVPLADRLHAATGLRIALDNDANCAALGEYRCGAGRGVRDVVVLTLGTGIGGGVILGGRLWRGELENAGELGHTIVQVGGRRCNCGQQGCVEAYASAAQTAARAAERLAAGEPSVLRDVMQRRGAIDADDVCRAAEAGDALARSVWDETCRYLAAACINIQHALNPQRIVLAGGMSAAGERLRAPVADAYRRMASSMLGQPPGFRLAELGNDAGFVGAAMGAFESDDD